ncbi:acyl-CoA dehydrogenase [Sphingobium sp. WCS2017Hpa-17]|uniref:acyl-CoA dehydrogenase n=1 Tax=Sphingobium sp. WCS2017Hpa-17 TaxID=3073638 RepID=UPI002889E19A|nr:acyl-CoA dehydrogenase [Sphingobium sp. WCS2017Hpa-17]
MTFRPAIAEQRFVLDHIVGLEAISSEAAEMADAILEGAGDLAVGAWAPLERLGDVEGPRRTEAGVTMPAGFVDAYQAYVDGGWGTIGAPVAFGGQGLPASLSVAVIETLGTANMGFALGPILTGGAVEALVHHGSPAQQAAYLPHLCSGAWMGTMNLTEPQAGSDVGAVRCRAEPVGDGTYRIKGTKIFISFGDHDLAENIIHLVLARTPGAPTGTKGLSLFLVPKYRLDPEGLPGGANDVRTVSIEHKLGLHASPTCVLSFGDNDACIGELIGEEGGGIRAMFTMMNNARLNVGLQGVQVAERATQRAILYARERIQGGRGGASVAIIEHPDVRRMLLRMKAQTQAARALVYYAFGQLDRAHAGEAAASRRVDLLTPLAKAHATDLGNEVASLGVQVHGGMGFIEETGAAQHFRDARITPIYEGTNGIQAADLVGRKLCMDNGETLFGLLGEMRVEVRHGELLRLIDLCEGIARRLLTSVPDDRLAASYPFLTMLSVAVAGWLMERGGTIAEQAGGDPAFLAMKRSSARFYLEQIVPEATGLAAAASASAAALYEIDADTLAA